MTKHFSTIPPGCFGFGHVFHGDFGSPRGGGFTCFFNTPEYEFPRRIVGGVETSQQGHPHIAKPAQGKERTKMRHGTESAGGTRAQTQLVTSQSMPLK